LPLALVFLITLVAAALGVDLISVFLLVGTLGLADSAAKADLGEDKGEESTISGLAGAREAGRLLFKGASGNLTSLASLLAL
jgi:hypothetical protein